MSSADAANIALRWLEPRLQRPSSGGLDSLEVADQIAQIRRIIARDGPRWVDLETAARLLAGLSTDDVATWARIGLLRSRRGTTGRTEVCLDDVLCRREESEALGAIGGDDLSEGEWRRLLPFADGRDLNREQAQPAGG